MNAKRLGTSCIDLKLIDDGVAAPEQSGTPRLPRYYRAAASQPWPASTPTRGLQPPGGVEPADEAACHLPHDRVAGWKPPSKPLHHQPRRQPVLAMLGRELGIRRLLLEGGAEIVAGVRRACRPDFQLGLRLSPERWGMRLGEVRELAASLMAGGALDWLDLSLWDAAKQPEEAAFASRPLVAWFTDLPRGTTRLGVAGKITTPRAALAMLEAGADFVLVGRTAILHPDWAERARDADFRPVPLPVRPDYLADQGCGPRFVRYLHTFAGFVEAEQVAS